LLGVRCNHRGEDNRTDAVIALAGDHQLLAVCPETMGGLPTPRPAAAADGDGRVTTADGVDVTHAFRRGAEAAAAVARAAGATEAVLKARSPSCDPSCGITAAALRAIGVRIRSEEDLSR
jgi:uncharacterized protein YbbK (DUF523 family)